LTISLLNPIPLGKPYVSHPHSLESPDSKSDYLADPTSPWSPRVIRRCDKTVNPDSAACTVARVAWRGGLYGEDLEYPDFRIRLPLFADDKTERDWVELVKEIEGRAVMEDGYLVYRNQVGENYVRRRGPLVENRKKSTTTLNIPSVVRRRL
jgi:hypothetical protein